MTNSIITIEQAAALLPAAQRQRRQQGLAVTGNFAAGIRDAFPVLSIRGKVFRARIDGEETPLIDPQTRQAIPFLDVIMVNASEKLSKNYYIGSYDETDSNNPPNCWSLDSIRPDQSVAQKVSLSCISCPMNAFNSDPSGRGGKACQDQRRVAVIMPHMLGMPPEKSMFLMRVPQSSLKEMRKYVNMLDRSAIDPNVVITRLSFDFNEAYPKLIFNMVSVLDDARYQTVLELGDGPLVKSMLESPVFDDSVSARPAQQTVVGGGFVPQAGPIVGQPTGAAPQQAAQPQPGQQQGYFVPPTQAQQVVQPQVQEVPPDNDIIQLPDGKLFSKSKGAYVERPAPAPVTPQVDPAILALPDGKFFNPATGKYVVSQLVDAAEVGAAPVVAPQAGPVIGQPAVAATPVKRTRKTKADAQAASPQAQATATQQAAPAPAGPVMAPVENQTAHLPNGGDAPAGAQVQAAPPTLESLLTNLLPDKPQ